MKCDICNQEFANSEEVKAHQEEAHPIGDGEEKPVTSDSMQMDQSETPEAAEQRNR